MSDHKTIHYKHDEGHHKALKLLKGKTGQTYPSLILQACIHKILKMKKSPDSTNNSSELFG